MKNFQHQTDVLARSKDLREFALFWEMGTGKSKTALDTARHLYESGKIDAVLVLAPNGVHRNWIEDELPKWLPEAHGLAWISAKAGTGRAKNQRHLALQQPLPVVAMSYEGFMTPTGTAFAKKLFGRRVLMILDESTKIKTPSAKRTQRIVAAGKHAAYRRILTGTPVTNSPFDIYTQMRFLSPAFWKDAGFKTYSEFKVYFGVFRRMAKTIPDPRRPGQMRVVEWDQTVSYRNLPRLQEILEPISSRVLKTDALDLPPKMYTKRYFEMSKEQARVYKELRDNQIAFLANGEILTVPLMLTVYLRLQQVTSNYLPSEDGTVQVISDFNPRLEALIEIAEQLSGKAIIWARFQEDINQIMAALGEKAVRYDGRVSSDDRVAAKREFQDGDAQFFVANPAVGATGLTLTAATTVIYYSNSFSLEDRLQSEDRAHRIGQEHPVHYIDLVAPGTVDVRIVNALRSKLNLASQVTGDNIREWI